MSSELLHFIVQNKRTSTRGGRYGKNIKSPFFFMKFMILSQFFFHVGFTNLQVTEHYSQTYVPI